MAMYDAFISYNNEQKVWVRKLVTKLREAGVEPFFDEEVGLAGSALARALAEGVLQSRCCVVVLTPESVKSGWVGHEIQHALKLDIGTMRRFIIPILLKGCSIPSDLSHIAFIDCRKGLGQKQFKELLKAIGQRRNVELKGDGSPSHQWWWCRSSVNVNLADIAFLDTSRGWIVGNAGTILHTKDGGRSWIKQESGTEQSLYSIAFHKNGNRGWIVGEHATILETVDSGKHWTLLETPLKADFLSVDLCSNHQALCIVGSDGLILRRGVNEKRWKHIPSPANETLWSVQFSSNGQLGSAVGRNGAALISEDGGNTWKRKKLGTTVPLYSTTVLPDGSAIWVTGDEGTILVSKDKGKSWQNRQYSVSPWESWLNTIKFSPDGQTGWVVGVKGTILNSIDGGDSWSAFYVEDIQDLVDIVYQDNETIWIVGQDGVVLTTKQA